MNENRCDKRKTRTQEEWSGEVTMTEDGRDRFRVVKGIGRNGEGYVNEDKSK